MATFDPNWLNDTTEWIDSALTAEGTVISAKEKTSAAGNTVQSLCVKTDDGRLVMGYLTYSAEAIDTVKEAGRAMSVDISGGTVEPDAWLGRRVRFRTAVNEGRSRRLCSVSAWMVPTTEPGE